MTKKEAFTDVNSKHVYLIFYEKIDYQYKFELGGF